MLLPLLLPLLCCCVVLFARYTCTHVFVYSCCVWLAHKPHNKREDDIPAARVNITSHSLCRYAKMFVFVCVQQYSNMAINMYAARCCDVYTRYIHIIHHQNHVPPRYESTPLPTDKHQQQTSTTQDLPDSQILLAIIFCLLRVCSRRQCQTCRLFWDCAVCVCPTTTPNNEHVYKRYFMCSRW